MKWWCVGDVGHSKTEFTASSQLTKLIPNTPAFHPIFYLYTVGQPLQTQRNANNAKQMQNYTRKREQFQFCTFKSSFSSFFFFSIFLIGLVLWLWQLAVSPHNCNTTNTYPRTTTSTTRDSGEPQSDVRQNGNGFYWQRSSSSSSTAAANDSPSSVVVSMTVCGWMAMISVGRVYYKSAPAAAQFNAKMLSFYEMTAHNAMRTWLGTFVRSAASEKWLKKLIST